MAELDELATKTLIGANLPHDFSHRQAFILGYNKRKALEYALLYGSKTPHPLDNQDILAKGYVRVGKEGSKWTKKLYKH